jgi:hypothetical protein
VSVVSYLRPTYEPAITVTSSLDQKPTGSRSIDDWVVSSGWLDAHGNQITQIRCSGHQSFQQCLQADGATALFVSYQPADRFWPFQWIETSIYLAIAALAVGVTAYLVRRRLV